MKEITYLLTILFISSCATSYSQKELFSPSAKLDKQKSVMIIVPENGFYEGKEYENSGKITALSTRAAFAKFTNNSVVSRNCKDLVCIQNQSPSLAFDYYVVPEILHWEDRATEWSGILDKLEIKISIYEGKEWREVATSIISGKSKWMTLGGDHPQDLIPVPMNKYIESLYQ